MLICSVCSHAMKPDLIAGTWRCSACALFESNFEIQINTVETIDEDRRERALKSLRLKNFNLMLLDLQGLLLPSARLLDIGCAHGWFLDAATAFGLDCTGIEPDETIARHARTTSRNVILGFFPADMPPNSKFDVITFNDVFEHLPNPKHMAQSLADFLNPNGLVIITLPVSDCGAFRLARLAARFGFTKPLARLWQVGFPSPHVSYFSAENLVRLFHSAGFDLVKSAELEAIPKEGLYQRIRYDRSVSQFGAIFLYALARAARFVLSFMPPDIRYFDFRQRQPRTSE